MTGLKGGTTMFSQTIRDFLARNPDATVPRVAEAPAAQGI